MATLQTTEDFRKAISYLQNVNHFGNVTLQMNIGDTVAECEVLDDDTLTDITPDTATLEAALDSANAALTEQAAQATVQANAKVQASAIPNWATWTEAEALAWHDTNIANALPVANLAAANVVLDRLATENRALVRMVIALRNQVWSDLQG